MCECMCVCVEQLKRATAACAFCARFACVCTARFPQAEVVALSPTRCVFPNELATLAAYC